MESLPVTAMAYQVVKPTNPPPYPIALLRSCSLDLVIANMYVKTVYFYKHNDVDSPDFFSTEVLTKALSQALSLYYPMAGTLTADMDIQCNGKGALFVEATAHCTLADLGDLTPSPRLLRLVPTLVDPSLQRSWQPLLLIQITRFECGGVAMGVALEHHVADGISALSFFMAWTTIARGETLRMYPSFDKTWLRSRCPPKPQFTHDEYLKLPKPRSDIFVSREQLGQGQELVVRTFELPEEFLQRMRRDHEVGSAKLTTYEMLAAHVWRCCCKARALRQEEKSMLVMAVDGRSRLAGEELGEDAARRYVGNVIFNCCLSLAVSQITGGSSSLHMVGKSVQAALRSVDKVHCCSAIDFLETCTRQQLESFAKGPHTFASPNLGFISWTNLPFYETSDFGWGRASHVGPAHVAWEGHAYLLRSSAGSSTLRLCISLQRRHMPTFARLLFVLTTP